MRISMLLLGVVGCSVMPVSALIRSPIDSQCQSLRLNNCPDLVEGAVLYAEGDQALGAKKLERARARNSPQQLEAFADALRKIGEAAPETGKPLAEVAALLKGESSPRPDAAAASAASTTATAAPLPTNPLASASPTLLPPSSPPSQASSFGADFGHDAEQLTLYSLTARTDPMRLVSETVFASDARGVDCMIAGRPAVCLRRKQGALIVTDVVASEECGQRVFLAAANGDAPALGLPWVLPARTTGVHGGSFVVAGWQWLFVAIQLPPKPQIADGACFVTWSGFKPRLVPALGKKDGGF